MKLNTRIAFALSLALALLGIAYAQTKAPAPQPVQSNLGSSGRYQIVMNPNLARNTFMLDTQTGRVWQWVTFSFLEGDPQGWVIQPRLDSEKDEIAWTKQQPHKKEP